MHSLITGGAGFIGSHLAEELLRRGQTVTAVDDFSTGSRDNVRHLEGSPRFRLVHATCADVSLMGELVDGSDRVFHLAAAVGVKLIVEAPVRTIETNIRLTDILLGLAARRGRPVFVASTSEVYGKSDRLPFQEDGDLVLGPTSKSRWSYACSKAIDEFLALAYWKERELPTVVARLFNTVGPRQTGRYGMVVPTFVRQALAGEPITVYGDGTQTRCFTHVADVVRAIVALMDHEPARGQVFNVGNDQEITIGELAQKVRARSGSSSEIVHVPYDEAYEEGFEDMRRRVPATGKIRNAVGWSPRLGLDDILDDVIGQLRQAA
jgi:UDP-glucose 4-epimerase